MKLSLFNSLTRKKEIFVPIDSKNVRMYVCGPTIYDSPHIGNARSIVVFDLLYRILIMCHGKEHVTYVRNITDVDDKIIEQSKKKKIKITELTNNVIHEFQNDISYLGCLKPNFEPKATNHINDMIDMIQKLIDEGYAYESSGHVYFSVNKFEEYGKLHGALLDQMISNVRIEKQPGKRNDHDFVLWKPFAKDDPISARFDSKFGIGRPGWHIECSAMSYKYLGENFDIHGGGLDLIFPHHTNEIAQNKCSFPGSKFANIFVHNGFLTVDNQKMSKSLNNFVKIEDLRKNNISGDVIRLFLLSSHYRKPLDYNDKAISDTTKLLQYWYTAIKQVPAKYLLKYDEVANAQNIYDMLPKEFTDHLLNDMNSSLSIYIINNYAKQVLASLNFHDKISYANKLLCCCYFLNIMRKTIDEWFGVDDNNEIVLKLLEERNIARSNKDWKQADLIRDKLLSEMNVIVEDDRDGKSFWYHKK